MQYTETELDALIKSVEKEFNAELAKAETDVGAALAKSEDSKHADEEKKPKEKAPEGEAHPKDEQKADEAAQSEPEAGHDKEKDPDHPENQAKEEAKEEKNPDDGCGYDDEDMEHMHKMYMSMSKAECKAHHDACRKALDAHGLEKCGDMAMAKSESIKPVEVKEVKIELPKNDQEVALLKSEVEAEKAKNADLKKNFDAVSEFLTKLVKKTVPQGKAITSLETIAKSESTEEKPLTKTEVTALLSKKASDPSLKKSDRDAINAYYLDGANINSISHLLK